MKGIHKDTSNSARGTGVLPKALFMFVAILGAALIWIIKWKAPDNDALLILVPVFFILIYCVLAYRTNLFYIREDLIGDNAYYLGFLFTLSSLAYALVCFQMDQKVGISNPNDIIGGFGVALWSTIVGISLRVFFAQMRQDPQDIEQEARAKIAHAASILSGDLYQASVIFNAYTRGLQQSVEEAFLRTKEISAKTVSSLETLNKKIEKIEAPDSIINRKIDGIFANLESATNRLNTLANSQTQSVEGLIESSAELVNGIKSLNTQITLMKDSTGVISSGAQNMQKISEIVNQLQPELARFSTGLSDLNKNQTQAVKEITKHADALESGLERSRKYTEETHESLASMTKTLAEKLQ